MSQTNHYSLIRHFLFGCHRHRALIFFLVSAILGLRGIMMMILVLIPLALLTLLFCSDRCPSLSSRRRRPLLGGGNGHDIVVVVVVVNETAD